MVQGHAPLSGIAANIAKAIIAYYILRLHCEYRIHRNMDMQASRIIDALGGTSATARLIEAPPSTVHSWRKIGIPPSRMAHLRMVANAQGVSLPDAHEPARQAVA
jgi:hypothetical protein